MRTYGYDYSFALSVDEVNKILFANLSSIDLELKYSGQDKQSGSTINMDAKCSPWQIIPGSQNTLLRFSVPISDGYLSIEGPISNSYDLTNVTVLIEVTLGWLGSSDIQETQGSGDITKLIFSPTQVGKPDNPGYVAVVNILDPDKQLDTVGLGLLRTYTSNILFENKDKINFIFANVFPKPKNLGSWLIPKKWIYYYSTGKAYDALCFLCMLSDDSFPADPKFDSGALIQNNNSTILISQKAFFNNVILPSIESTFSSGKFSISTNIEEDCTIHNNGDFTVSTSKGKITASSFNLTASNSGNGITSTTSGGGPLKFFFGVAKLPGASYTWSCKDTNPLKYANELIKFNVDSAPITHHDQHIKWYDWVILIALGITSLPGLISLIVDSINDFSDQVNNVGIGNINSSLDAAVVGSMVNLANLIDWSSNGKTFSVANSGLDGALFVYGDLS
ncbi:MAG: TULIP family P47-like protein [Anaerolineaceae bacterium]|nr:TULIP family P47-like protein [Anaerolineaceae bacterium]